MHNDAIESETPPHWRELFGRNHVLAVVVLAGGIGLYAMNLYFTAALMPSVVKSIGGEHYYAWSYTGYLISAVIATLVVGPTLTSRGPALSYVVAFGLFALGTVLSAVSPVMALFVAGRIVQGAGAGMLTGLGYAVIRVALPERLWTRATGLISAMFGVGTLVGPSLGGLFAEFSSWRVGFAVLAALTLILAGMATRALNGQPPAGHRSGIPAAPVLALGAAAAALSASTTVSGGWMAIVVFVGALLLVVFLVLDARHSSGVLPRLTYVRGNHLKWVYLTVAGLCAGVMVENFIPLFGQELAGLSPLTAGLLGAVLSMGWVVAQLFSTSIPGHRTASVIRWSPILLIAGLAGFGLLLQTVPSGGRIVAWIAMLVLAGVGIGLAFPHLNVAAMASSADEYEGAKAAAALSTTQLIAFTLASAVAGILLEIGHGDRLAAARWVTLGLAVLTTPALFAATPAARTKRNADA